MRNAREGFYTMEHEKQMHTSFHYFTAWMRRITHITDIHHGPWKYWEGCINHFTVWTMRNIEKSKEYITTLPFGPWDDIKMNNEHIYHHSIANSDKQKKIWYILATRSFVLWYTHMMQISLLTMPSFICYWSCSN